MRQVRPFPNDPQWLQLSRKLPPDAVIKALLRFGFRPSDIADRFDTHPSNVSLACERLGLPKIPPGSTCRHVNGAHLRRPRWDIGFKRKPPHMVVNL